MATWPTFNRLSCPTCRVAFTSIERADGTTHGVAPRAGGVGEDAELLEVDSEDELLEDWFCDECGQNSHDAQLLICDTPDCRGAAHTLCIGLNGVPETGA